MSRADETVTESGRKNPALWKLAFFLALAWSGAALAQDHTWITGNPAYVRADGVHCCGADHCKPQAEDFAEETPKGWLVPSTGQMFAEDARGLYRPRDWQIWACLNVVTKQVDCLFVKPGAI